MSRDPAGAPSRASETHDHPHDHGGCLCDHPPTEAEATPDHALPEASGGVAHQAEQQKETA